MLRLKHETGSKAGSKIGIRAHHRAERGIRCPGQGEGQRAITSLHDIIDAESPTRSQQAERLAHDAFLVGNIHADMQHDSMRESCIRCWYIQNAGLRQADPVRHPGHVVEGGACFDKFTREVKAADMTAANGGDGTCRATGAAAKINKPILWKKCQPV